ncbi:MAG: DUF255 domain-containing protein [Chitinophagaceae bacterium]|nr:DUF255 domain-containing protein [Chitinophagaceae bacterium]
MKSFVLTILLFISYISYSQVSFTAGSFDSTLQTAKETGKIIFLQYEASNCEQCNEVAGKAFESKKLGEQINSIFTTINISSKHPDRKRIAKLYDLKEEAFGTLFIAGDGTLLHSFLRTSSMAKSYETEIDIVLTKASEGMRLNTILSEYEKGNRNPIFLEELMAAKKNLNLDTDTLLNEYVRLLPKDSLESVRTIIFLAKMAPVIDSRPDNAMRRSSRFNEAWNSLPLNERISINGRIVHKSMNKAAREKNERYAYRVSDFRKFTYNPDYRAGQKAADYEMIQYYLETKDTLNYLIRSVYFYDNYYMTISVDSIKRKDSLSFVMMVEKQKKEQPVQDGVNQRTITFTPTTQHYARELNNAANNFYDLSGDPLYLAKAIQWSERANQFHDHYTTMNTYALLLYKVGKKEEAIAWEKKAIKNKKTMGYDTKRLEKELDDMEKGKPLMKQTEG